MNSPTTPYVTVDALIAALRGTEFHVEAAEGIDGVYEVSSPHWDRRWLLVPPSDPTADRRIAGMLADLARMTTDGRAAGRLLGNIGWQPS